MPYRLPRVNNAIADGFNRWMGNRWKRHRSSIRHSLWWFLCCINSESMMIIDSCQRCSIVSLAPKAIDPGENRAAKTTPTTQKYHLFLWGSSFGLWLLLEYLNTQLLQHKAINCRFTHLPTDHPQCKRSYTH
jgi:hypothetical protein